MLGWAFPLAVILLLPGVVSAGEISDHSKTDRLLSNFQTLQLAPGDTGTLAFVLADPYPWPMENVRLEAEIYRFASMNVVLAVSEIPEPPRFSASDSSRTILRPGSMIPGDEVALRMEVRTTPETPAGGFFTQGTYFIRFRLEFDYGEELHAVLVSKGHFTTEEWAYATRLGSGAEGNAYRYEGDMNLTYLGERVGLESLDGMITETAFGIKVLRPNWPIHLLAVGAAVAMGLAAYFYWREQRSPDP